MMKLQVKQVAEAKGIRSANQLSLKTGIPLASMYKIWRGDARMIALDTLEKICIALDVPAGLLFKIVPDEQKTS
jgi:putative transcriptional regulator